MHVQKVAFVEIWSGRLLIKNLSSVAGLKKTKNKTYLLVCHASPTRLVQPFLRSDGSKVAGCLKAKFRTAYVTPRVPSMQLLLMGTPGLVNTDVWLQLK